KERLVSDPEFGSSGSSRPPVPSTGCPPREGQFLSAGGLSATPAPKGAGSVVAGPRHRLAGSVTVTQPARADGASARSRGNDLSLLDKLDTRLEAAKRASAWLSDRLVDLRNQLRASEEAVTDFRAQHGFYQSGANVTLNQQQLSELNAKLVEARADVAQKK